MAAIMGQSLNDPRNPLLFNGFFVYFFYGVHCFVLPVSQPLHHSYDHSLRFFSLFFYKASGSYVVLVIISAITDYLLSNLISRQSRHWARVSLLVMSIIVNLDLLFYFKLANESESHQF